MNRIAVVDLVLKYPEEKGDETALVFLKANGEEKEKFTFNELRTDCLKVATNINAVCPPKEMVLLIVEDQSDFVLGFFGSMLAGRIPAPLSSFRNIKDRQGYGRMVNILKSGLSRYVLTEESRTALVFEILKNEGLTDVEVITIESLKDHPGPYHVPVISPGDIAYIQYTSGSTSNPKGVVLRHKNVINNLAKMLRVFQRSESVRVAGWIPFHHDMGLVGHLFTVLFESGFGVFLPAYSFISSPHLWLQAISKYAANTAAAPTFTFEHCSRKIRIEDTPDISCWKYAYVGSETVSLPVLEQFYNKFKAAGFNRNSFKPVYGLAEVTLLAAGGTLGLSDLDDRIYWKETGKNQKRALIPYLIDTEDTIKIVDVVTGDTCADGETGEVLIYGPSNSIGYYEELKEQAGSESVVIRTGDTGFVRNGFLYLTGRTKEIIIVRGVNYAAEDMEACVRYRQTGLQSNDYTVCISYIDNTKEKFLVFQEVHRHKNRSELQEIAAIIKANLAGNYGVTPDEIVFIAQGLIPKTRNYKIARTECLRRFLAGKMESVYSDTSGGKVEEDLNDDDPVVIVGMACRFPGGADSPEKYWQLLASGTDAVTEVPASRWDNDLFYDARPAIPGKVNTRWAGFIDNIDQFDPGLFGISAYEAPELDPQQRLLLETSWRLIENVGVKKTDIAGSDTGVFIGMSTNDYLYMKIKLSPGMEGFNAYSGLGNSNSVAANRLSYFYDFKGPSLTVDTACSSSLTALHLAAQAILNGTCTQAITGGVNAILSPGPTITLSQFGMMSPEGRCKTFDAGADGYVRAEGCGLVMLKRRSAAIKDGNEILATLSASAIGQDGHTAGITFPNGKSQYRLIEQTLQIAGLHGDNIGYVEAHGTGTSSGDPIEMEQIRKLYGKGADNKCYVGAVKANIGHLEAAAGIASVIKTVLMLQKKKVPPQIHLHTLNPQIQLDDTRLAITKELVSWDSSGTPRRAAISSFGFGGSLSHIILTEPGSTREPQPDDSVYKYAQRPFVFSASSAKGLSAQAQVLRNWLDHEPGMSIEDICYTQAECRSDLKFRQYFVVNGVSLLKEKLDNFINIEGIAGARPAQQSKVCFLFTGQGEHYQSMGKTLYYRFPVFKNAFDRCAVVIDREIGSGFSLSHIAFEEKDTTFWLDEYMQPILFALQYALGILWQECGVMPDYLLGHSLGEYAAACLAGCFEPETGMAILLKRAKLVSTIEEPGIMVTFFTGHEDIRAVMDPSRVRIAAINSDKKTVVSGINTGVVELLNHFAPLGVETYHLKTSHAFHSHLMQPIADEFSQFLDKYTFKKPEKKWISSLMGREMHNAPDTRYWVDHLLSTVNFKEAIHQLPPGEQINFIEIGPGASTLVAVNDTLNVKDALLLRSLNIKKGDRTEDYFFFDSIGKLYQSGINIDWSPLFTGRLFPGRIPVQKFMHQSYWMAGINASRLSEFASPSAIKSHANCQKETDSGAALYSLRWKSAGSLPSVNHETDISKDTGWIVAGNASPFVDALLTSLKDGWANVYWIGLHHDTRLKKIRPDFTLSPGSANEESVAVIDKIVNLKSRKNIGDWKMIFVAPDADAISAELDLHGLESQVGDSLGVLIPLLQSLKKNALVLPVWIITGRSQYVNEDDFGNKAGPNIAHAPVWGFAKTLFLEHPELRGGLIDIEQGTLPSQVLGKIIKPRNERCIAIRNGEQYIEQIIPGKATVPATIAFRADGIYLITGGIGGLGLQCADWIVKNGGRHLVLLSRRKLPARDTWPSLTEADPDYKIIRQLRALQDKGAVVEVLSMDVRDTKALEQLFSGFDQRNIPVRGIIHAAGVNWFSKVMALNRTDFLDTLKTKVSASWVLHRLSINRDLDCFILFSSVSALWGSVELSHYTAANHFMDMLSIYRSGKGLPSLCINWGPWAEVGMSAADRETEVLERLGFNLMPPAAALTAMQKELSARVPLSLVADIEWEKFRTFIDFSLQSSLFSEVVADNKTDLRNEGSIDFILKSTPVKARQLVEDAVRMKLRNVMLIESTDKIDAGQRFNFLGMDSLMSISFAAELEQYFGCKLPNTLVYNYPHIKAVSDFIFSIIYKEHEASGPETGGVKTVPVKIIQKEDPGTLFKVIQRPAGAARLKIFCFPYIGAGASIYEQWAGIFGDDVELIAIQPPGREERSDMKPYFSMQALTSALLSGFTEPEQDFVFFGHSFGAMIAYEFYLSLKRNNKKVPKRLFLSCCEAPLKHSSGRLHELPEPEFIEEIVLKYENSKDINERKTALSNNSSPMRADVQILESYIPGRELIEIPVTVIAGLNDIIAQPHEVKQWINLAKNDFAIYYLNGGHEMLKENSKELIKIVKEGASL